MPVSAKHMGEDGLSFEPQKFFIGLIDFFSILMPGALLAFVLRIRIERWPELDQRLRTLDGPKGWVAFLVASYMLGHLVFLLGSWLDEAYDWLRGRTLDKQIQQLSRSGKTFHWWVRFPVWLVFKRERGQAVELAGKIKEEHLSRLKSKKSINNFQWCKAFLALESPESLAVVNRLEADSKFFRCLIVVLLAVLGFLVWDAVRYGQARGKIAFIAVGLIIFALWRYMEQRFKASNQAYWSVITLTGSQNNLHLKTPNTGGVTHAGGVLYRIENGQRQYLMVESKKCAREFVLPKGKIEGDETNRETAIREVHEETGVWAKICKDLDKSSYTVNGKSVRVHFFLMEPVARGFRSDRLRGKEWRTFEDATKKPCFRETKEILEKASAQIDQRLAGANTNVN